MTHTAGGEVQRTPFAENFAVLQANAAAPRGATFGDRSRTDRQAWRTPNSVLINRRWDSVV